MAVAVLVEVDWQMVEVRAVLVVSVLMTVCGRHGHVVDEVEEVIVIAIK
jgi:hypothetical protein